MPKEFKFVVNIDVTVRVVVEADSLADAYDKTLRKKWVLKELVNEQIRDIRLE